MKKYYTTIIVLVVFMLFIAVGIYATNGGVTISMEKQGGLTLNDISQRQWDELGRKKIFFGHQSVGYNIITGIEQILKENPNIKLNIIKTTSADDLKGPALAHDWIGANRDPRSKIVAFERVMKGGIGDKVDIAFMKMCYVDITSSTNVDDIFHTYKQKMAQLESQFSNTEFVHMTVPLTAKPEGMQSVKQAGKNAIKKILGKQVFDYTDNINRGKFNKLLKAEYEGKALIFDLALIESIGRDRNISSFINEGEQIPTLANEYTDDGGHLNAEGSRLIAEQLLIFLANR